MSERSRMIDAIMELYGVRYGKLKYRLMGELEQVLNCKTPEAARILLGVSRKEKKLWKTPSVKPQTIAGTFNRTPDGRFAPRKASRGGTKYHAA